jgi:2-polyprenyl-6-methoxyphenol hydroxylase-like FAD-dependent oxidoreductase
MGHRSTHALVLGGGLAGMLAAHVLAQHVDAVTLIDRDHFPDHPAHRKGTPQDHHTHVLVSGGARALDELMPGTTTTLLHHGAQYIGLPNNYLQLAPHGWFPRLDEMQYILGCSRILLEWVVRTRLRDQQRVTVLEGTEVVGLTGDADAITGAVTRSRTTQQGGQIDADIVVDATGRGSRTTQWLAELGFPAVPEAVIDPHIFYVSRIYRPPAGAEKNFPAVNIQADPLAPHTRESGLLMPIEDGHWTVTLTGSRGNEPSTDDHGFERFARHLRHSIIAELLAAAEPAEPAFGFRPDANRRRFYERIRPGLRGLVVLGDAYATFNPVYGHGMAVCALAAVALRNGLRRHGLHPRSSRNLQHHIARATTTAWNMATSQDIRYPATTGARRPGLGARMQHAFQDRLTQVGTPAIAAASLDVYTLSTPMTRVLAPRVLFDVVRGAKQQALSHPPFTAEEQGLFMPPAS